MRNVAEWKRLADVLRHQRVVVLGKRSRAAFARELGISDRVLHDLENAQRDNYEVSTLLSLEKWYGLTATELRDALGDLYPIHEVLTPHSQGTIASSRSDSGQTEAHRQASIDQLLLTIEAMREELINLKRGDENCASN